MCQKNKQLIMIYSILTNVCNWKKIRKYDIIINIKKVVKSKNGGQCERYAD